MKILWCVVVPALCLLIAGLTLVNIDSRGGCRVKPIVSRQQTAPPARPVSAFRRVVLPTEQPDFDPERAGAFQPTASGNATSALYGSVRTVKSAGGLESSFHEGVDIAPVRRDAAGRPCDAVRVVADGTVGYINRLVGNSNYGLYVVVLHADPIGEVYTLYAHLAALAPGLTIGQSIGAGATLGLMGHTPPSIIPLDRAHMHFEVGMISNSRFDRWFRGQRLKPDHGIFNGLNLQALSPLVFFREADQAGASFTFSTFLRQIPVAFEVLVAAPAQADYFRRYPGLWQGAEYAGGAMVVACSENGTILQGRQATVEERREAAGAPHKVVSVDEHALGRNGCHLVTRQNGQWKLGSKGERWLEIWTY